MMWKLIESKEVNLQILETKPTPLVIHKHIEKGN